MNISNILKTQKKEKDLRTTKAYEPITSKGALRRELSRLFFNNYLPNNLLDSEAPKAKEGVFTTEMVSIYVATRQALFDFLVKDTEETINPFLKKNTLCD